MTLQVPNEITLPGGDVRQVVEGELLITVNRWRPDGTFEREEIGVVGSTRPGRVPKQNRKSILRRAYDDCAAIIWRWRQARAERRNGQ